MKRQRYLPQRQRDKRKFMMVVKPLRSYFCRQSTLTGKAVWFERDMEIRPLYYRYIFR